MVGCDTSNYSAACLFVFPIAIVFFKINLFASSYSNLEVSLA